MSPGWAKYEFIPVQLHPSKSQISLNSRNPTIKMNSVLRFLFLVLLSTWAVSSTMATTADIEARHLAPKKSKTKAPSPKSVKSTKSPTLMPSGAPTAPTVSPTPGPTPSPTEATPSPTMSPTISPAPTEMPSAAPTKSAKGTKSTKSPTTKSSKRRD